MFDLISVIFQKVGAVVGSVLIGVGTFISGAPYLGPVEVEAVEIEVGSETQARKESTTSRPSLFGFGVKSESRELEKKAETAAVPSETSLQIESVSTVSEDGIARVSWTTTLPAESRLIFDNGEGRVFESKSGFSTTHSITTVGLEESGEYDFKITAVTKDKSQSDDYFGTVYAEKNYTARLVTKTGDCQTILVVDTAGRAAVGKEVTIRPSLAQGAVSKQSVTATTNARGEVKYCESADTYKIVGTKLNITLYAL